MATITLDPCIKILCDLGAAVIAAINRLLAAQIVALEAQVAALEAQLLTLDILTAPLQLAQTVAIDALEAARTGAQLIPLDLIAGCVSAGDINVNLIAAIDVAEADINDVLDDLNRLLSFRAEVVASIQQFENIIAQFQQVQLVLAECGT